MYTWSLVFHMKSGNKFNVKFETNFKTSDDVLQHFADILSSGGINQCVFKQSAISVISITLNEVEAIEVTA